MPRDEKPKDGQIKVSCDSGANIHSRNHDFLDAVDLGFESRAEWDAATDDEKLEAVRDHFMCNGYPEFSWED